MKSKSTLITILAISLTTLLIGIYIGQAQTNNTFWIAPGVYPGASTFTMWNAGGGTWNAKDSYGRVRFTGSSESTIAQSIHDAMPYGGTVKILNNTVFDAQVNITTNGISWEGTQFKQTEIAWTYAGNAFFINNSVARVSYGAFKYLEFVGASSFLTDQCAIYASYVTGFTITDCEFHNIQGNNSWAIVLERSSAFHIEHNRFWNNFNGIIINGSSYNTVNYIDGNYITRAVGWDDNSDGTAIWVGSTGAGTKITDNVLENHYTRVHVDCNNMMMHDNYFEWDASKQLIDLLLDGGRCTMIGNEFSENISVTGTLNRFVGNQINDLNDTGSGNDYETNLDFITEWSGTAEASNGDTITFGITFGGIPQTVIVTVEENDDAYCAQVTGVTTTQFTLALFDDTGAVEAVDKTIDWFAEYRP